MTRRTTGSRLAKFARWRGWIQAAFLLAWLNPWLVRIHSVCSPVFHCYSCPLATFACPIGVMANFSALHLVPWIAIGTVLATGALFGSLICGWVCPFGGPGLGMGMGMGPGPGGKGPGYGGGRGAGQGRGPCGRR